MLSVGACAALLAFAACGTDTGGSSAGSGDPGGEGEDPTVVKVPDVTGEDAAAAASELEDAGLDVGYDEGEPENASLCSVTDQDVAAEEVAEQGDTITLTLECQVEVPDLSGQPADQAETDLQDLELEAAYETEPDDPSACTVDEQDFEGGEAVDKGETVTLTLLCEVPDVTGEDAESATSELEAAGYSWAYDTEPYDASACTVDYQDPTSDAEPDAEIELQLSCEEGDGY